MRRITPLGVLMQENAARPTECWEWPYARDKDGYGLGRVGEDRRMVRIHRAAYELAKAAIPAGLAIDHLCRNRACFNPAHLEPVTPRENTLRGGNAAKTHCKRGHLLAVHGRTKRWRGRVVGRECATCVRKWDSESKKAKRRGEAYSVRQAG